MSAPYGFVFTVLAMLAAFTALLAEDWSLWPIRFAATATAISFLLVAVAYFGVGPRLLFKRATGNRHPLAWLIHTPYYTLTAFSYCFSLLISRETAYVQIAPNIFLGRRLTTREAKRAESEGWVAVLDLAAELTEPWPLRQVKTYCSLPVLDATAMSLDQLREAVEWMKTHATNGPVYVHCALGHGRSATVATAYLLDIGLAPDMPTAVKHLQQLRPGVRLHRTQQRLLKAFME